MSGNKPLEDLPPSCLLIYYAIEQNGKMTQKEMRQETRMAARTVRYALKRLIDNDYIISAVKPTDPREDYYYINTLRD